MVRGTPSWVLAGRALVASALGLVSTGSFGIGLAIRGRGYEGSAVLTVLLVVIVLSALYYVSSSIALRRRLKQEARAGYTTSRSQAVGLEEVDWKTGRVIRLGTEPRISRDELKRRRAAVRAPAAGGAEVGSAGGGRR